MSEYIIWILIISLWNVILFYGKSLGVSVILFMIPLLIYLYVFLKKNNKINNKKGLLFMIPIVLLSITYLIFNSSLFSILNVPVIIALFLLMYVYTIKPTYKFFDLFEKALCLLFEPISYIGRFFRVATSKISDKFKLSDKTKKILLSILIVIPIVFIVILLLSKADMIFANIFGTIFDKISYFLDHYIFNNVLGRIISFIIVFFAIGCSSMYLLYSYPGKEIERVKEEKNRTLYAVKILVTTLNIIYVVFDFIQIKSLLLHSVASNINYAEYARQGFFELMVVSIINLAVILISKKFENKNNKKEFKYINVMNIIMVLLTLIIIVSSFLRMYMYECAFGYTILRLLVYVALITEAIMMIPTSMYIFNSNFNIFKSYMIIIVVVYTLINFMNIDYVIARRNVNKYFTDDKIDIEYLMNSQTDNIPVLIELYNKTDQVEYKDMLGDYFIEVIEENKTDSIFEFNLSRYFNLKKLDKLDLNKYRFRRNNPVKWLEDYSSFE